jgi:hypothetical protein
MDPNDDGKDVIRSDADKLSDEAFKALVKEPHPIRWHQWVLVLNISHHKLEEIRRFIRQEFRRDSLPESTTASKNGWYKKMEELEIWMTGKSGLDLVELL